MTSPDPAAPDAASRSTDGRRDGTAGQLEPPPPGGPGDEASGPGRHAGAVLDRFPAAFDADEGHVVVTAVVDGDGDARVLVDGRVAGAAQDAIEPTHDHFPPPLAPVLEAFATRPLKRRRFKSNTAADHASQEGRWVCSAG